MSATDSPIDRARTYLAACPPAVSGQSGHNTAFSVVSNVVNGFDLSEHEALELLADWNRTCQPPWSDSELRHKVRDALNVGKVPKGSKLKGIRHRFGGTETGPQRAAPPARTADPARPPATPQNGKPVPRMPKVAVPFDAELPDPLPDPTRALLRAAFLEGESVRIVGAHTNEEGKEVPRDAGVILTREEWLRRLDEGRTYRKALVHDGNALFGGTDRNGIVVGINPMSGPRDADVTAYRHALIEWDTLPREDQWHIIQESGLPCTAVIGSGGKSVHAWVRVDARDRREYDERVRIIHEFLAEHQIDPKNKNPSRFSRLPGCDRGQARQELLAVHIGTPGWSQWLASIDHTSQPDIGVMDSFSRLAKMNMPTPPAIVDGLIRLGEKVVVGGASKSFKSWLVLDLGVCVNAGIPWLGRATTKGAVLIINLELPHWCARSRLLDIAKARGVQPADNLIVWTLRGIRISAEEIRAELRRRHLDDLVLIIVDPAYRLLLGRDENAAGDVGELLTSLGGISEDTGATLVMPAHFAKGDASTKVAIDRVSGSGVFARDPDTVLTLTRHEQPEAFTVESVLRTFPPADPFVVSWQHPVFSINSTLDPANLHKPARASAAAKVRPTPDQVLALFKGDTSKPRASMMTSEQLRGLFDAKGWDRTAAPAIRNALEGEGRLRVWVGPHNVKLSGLPPVVDAWERQCADDKAKASSKADPAPKTSTKRAKK